MSSLSGFIRPMFVAYEPWETRLGARLLSSFQQEAPGEEAMLFVVDPYQIRNKRSSKRLKLLQQSEYNLEVLFKELPQWQERIRRAETKQVDSSWKALAERFSAERLDLCLQSDVHLFPRERSPYYPRTTTTQKRQAALLVFNRILRTFEGFKPDVVIMIGDQYLAKNFIGLLSEEMSVPIRVIRVARVDDYYKADKFFFATESAGTVADSAEANQELSSKTDFGPYLYLGNLAVSDTAWLRDSRRRPWSSSRELVARSLRDQREKFKTGLSSRPREFRRLRFWVSSPLLVRLHMIANVFRRLRYVWGVHPFVQLEDIPEKYFLIPLHYRPESSVLTQGFGLADEDLVEEVSKILEEMDSGITCVVLENPSMVGLRRNSTYKSFLCRDNVLLADPALETQSLVQNALGVLTVSGTAALEASLHDVPVHVVGRPDYLEAMQSVGFESIGLFLESAASLSAPSSASSVRKYIDRMRTEGEKGSLGWSSVKSEKNQEEAVAMIRRLLTPDPKEVT